jgi:DNA-binding NarL/FixJ family response regulator
MFRILLADDHQGIRAQVRCVLETADWGVCGEAENGQEAVEKVRRLHPDLVILDMDMPGISGYEAAHEIRRISPSTKILILSMHDPANLPSLLAETGADAFVAKSRSVRELVPTLAHLLLGAHERIEAH